MKNVLAEILTQKYTHEIKRIISVSLIQQTEAARELSSMKIRFLIDQDTEAELSREDYSEIVRN